MPHGPIGVGRIRATDIDYGVGGMFRLFTYAIGMVAISLASGSPLLAAEYQVNDPVAGGVVNVRSGPGLDHGVIATLPAGTPGLEVSGCQAPDDNGRSAKPWCHVEWSGHSGWTSSCCISASSGGTDVMVDSGKRQNILSLRCIGKMDTHAPSLNHVVVSDTTFYVYIDMDNKLLYNSDKKLRGNVSINDNEIELLKNYSRSSAEIINIDRNTGNYESSWYGELDGDRGVVHVKALCKKYSNMKIF